MVSADKGASTGVRYKYGRNLNTNRKNALVIKNPEDYRLPILGHSPPILLLKKIIILFILMKQKISSQIS